MKCKTVPIIIESNQINTFRLCCIIMKQINILIRAEVKFENVIVICDISNTSLCELRKSVSDLEVVKGKKEMKEKIPKRQIIIKKEIQVKKRV